MESEQIETNFPTSVSLEAQQVVPESLNAEPEAKPPKVKKAFTKTVIKTDKNKDNLIKDSLMKFKDFVPPEDLGDERC